MTARALADKLVVYLKKAIKDFPDGFYDSMAFTQTGNNLSHPVTWGLLAQFVLAETKNPPRLSIDTRLNTGMKRKFQPDIAACDGDVSELNYLFFIDYESPNSSDGRPIYKDIVPYLNWSENSEITAPYVVITTLPDKVVSRWSSWETSNEEYQNVLQSPYKYWYSYYRSEFRKRRRKMDNIAVINIDGKRVKREFPQ